MKIQHPAWIFGIAIVCLLLLLSATSLFDIVFGGGQKNTQTTNTNSARNTARVTEDPLVTVVPKDVVAGTPQPLSSDPQIGATNPTVTIVEFGDFECEDCATMSPVFAQAVREYPNDVRLVWKDFPLPEKHLFAETAAIAARCAQDQDAFWQYHDALFEQQDTFGVGPWEDIADTLGLKSTEFENCLSTKQHRSLVVQGYFVARTFSLDTAPAYYINDNLVTGVKTYAELKALIETAKTESKS